MTGLMQDFYHLCSVCGQKHAPYYRDVRVVLAEVLGAEKYALCSCCAQPVENPNDAGYRRKYKRHLRRVKASVRVEDAFREYERKREEERDDEVEREWANDPENFGLRSRS